MNPHKTLKSLFDATGLAVTPKMACCRVLNTMGRFEKQSTIGQLSSTTYFTNEARATLESPDS